MPAASHTLLRQHQRLRSPALFQETYDQGKSWRGRLMVLFLRQGEGASLRLGVVASRAAVGIAVDRNRARRRLREAFRLQRSQFSAEFDVVLIARRALLVAPWTAVVSELLYLARKSGLMAKSQTENLKSEIGTAGSSSPQAG